MSGDWLSCLHNMSAPPRSVINVRAMQPDPSLHQSASGLHAAGWYHFLSAARMLFPEEVIGPLVGNPDATGGLTIRKPERAALAVARAIDGLMPTCETLASFDARSSDSLEDEVLQRVAAWDARALGLPCFALVEWRPFDESWEPHTRMLDPSARRTLTVLARQRGRLFLRDEAPVRLNLALHQRHRLLVPRSGVAA